MSKKSVVITGCSSGIGFATAKRLVEHGHKVYATARNPEKLKELADLGAETYALDVNDEASMQKTIGEITKSGSIDVLVNNAGWGLHGPMEDVPIEEVRAQFETNVFGLLRMTQLVLPHMRAQHKGLIVNMGSMGGRIAFPGGGAYHGTKYAVEAFSDSLRYEVKGFGIDVVVIEPGVIQSEWGQTAIQHFRFNPEGAYVKWMTKLTKMFEGVYSGKVVPGQGSSDDVAKVVERAVNARHPRTRYKVTPMAHVLVNVRRFVPGRLWDLLLRTSYPRPPR